jgi:hypothetical protein
MSTALQTAAIEVAGLEACGEVATASLLRQDIAALGARSPHGRGADEAAAATAKIDQDISVMRELNGSPGPTFCAMEKEDVELTRAGLAKLNSLVERPAKSTKPRTKAPT